MCRCRSIAALVLASLAWLPHAAVAQPGQLDTSFGTNGRVTTSVSARDSASALALQADGKIVAAGRAASSSDPSTGNFAVVRYNSNGTLDGSFGSAGKVTTDFAGFDDAATSIVIQPDGKIVVAGYATFVGFRDGMAPGQHLALARYNGTWESEIRRSGLAEGSRWIGHRSKSCSAARPLV